MIPVNAKAGDFFLVSFDGKKPSLAKGLKYWLMNGGFIRLGQWADGLGFGEYEHAAVYIGNDVIIQATNGGTRYGQASSYDSNDTLWSTDIIELTTAQRIMIIHAANGYINTPYSWADYAAIAAHRLHLLPATNWLKNYVATSKHMICSQLVDQCYEDAGVHLFQDKRWSGFVAPGDLAGLLINGHG